MADISKITLQSGTTYNIKDAKARSDIAEIQSTIAGGLTFLGETTTALADNATTNPITINSESVTAKKGDLAVYGKKEFLFNGAKWVEMGDLSLLKNLAYKDSASGNFTPAGNVSQSTFTGDENTVAITAADNTNGNYQPKGTVSKPTFTGTETTSSGKFTPEGTVGLTTTNKTATVSKTNGTATYTPEGTVAAPAISVKTAGGTTKVNSITAVGTLPSLSTTVENETLTIGFDAGTLPTKGADTTVKTSDAVYEASAPAFTGTGARLVTGNIPVPTSAKFTGTEGDVSVSGTPSGTVSQPTFTGTKAQLSGTVTPTGTVSKPSFTGTQGTVTVS